MIKAQANISSSNNRRPIISRFESIVVTILGAYLLVSYLLMPLFWRARVHPPKIVLEQKTTFKADGRPGDPINVGLIGTAREVIGSMESAGWYPAAKPGVITLSREVESILAHRKYLNAPVSNLYLWGRKQDIAFEQPEGGSPKKRHHVRFWISDKTASDGRPLWLGAATFDRNVGLSRLTYQVTHHISPDLDNERDKLLEDLRKTGKLGYVYVLEGVGTTLSGINGEGDRYFTDGLVKIAVLEKE